MWGKAREVSPLQPIGGIETQREARADFGVIFQFLMPHCALPIPSPPSPACCLKGSCVTPTGVPPSLGKMPVGFSAGSNRSENGSEAYLEGMGNSYDLLFHLFFFFISFFFSGFPIPGPVLQSHGNRVVF